MNPVDVVLNYLSNPEHWIRIIEVSAALVALVSLPTLLVSWYRRKNNITRRISTDKLVLGANIVGPADSSGIRSLKLSSHGGGKTAEEFSQIVLDGGLEHYALKCTKAAPVVLMPEHLAQAAKTDLNNWITANPLRAQIAKEAGAKPGETIRFWASLTCEPNDDTTQARKLRVFIDPKSRMEPFAGEGHWKIKPVDPDHKDRPAAVSQVLRLASGGRKPGHIMIEIDLTA